MRFAILCVLCACIVVPRDVVAFRFAFDFVRELLFPRVPVVTRVRRLAEGRAIGDDFAVLDTVGLIEQHGYPAEEHNVTTEDGYTIIFFRIPGSSRSPAARGKPVVFLQHGIFASSDGWVLRGPDHDLAFLLADEGYDVWLGNARGNSYGRSHTTFSPQDRDFWTFSFHEIGVWDLPKMIDHALENSGQETLFYIGHSMGTTASYILLSERPEYNDRMRLVISLAPIAIWKVPPNPFINLVVLNGDTIKRVLDENDIFELGPQTANNVRLGRAFCSDNSVTQSACAGIYFMLAGDDPKQLNNSFLPQLTSYIPAGISADTLDHFRQNLMSGIFQKFDLGYSANFRLYRKKKPPIYEVKKISAPIALIYGKNDIISIKSNADELVKRLQNVVTFEAVPYDSFNHLDFLWAINAKELLFDRIIEIMANYSKCSLDGIPLSWKGDKRC